METITMLEENEALLPRRACDRIFVGNVPVGGGSPIVVQSMTNTPTTDVKATVKQIHDLEKTGVEIVRVSCPTQADTAALPAILKEITVPLVADIHFHHQRAIEAVEAGVACLRINPGTMALRKRQAILSALKGHDCALRIGINGGSLEKDLLRQHQGSIAQAMATSARRSALWFYERDFSRFKVSVKASSPLIAVEGYRLFAQDKEMRCPLHLGVTEAGGGNGGIVRSSVALGILLLEGIGDTVRISLTDVPTVEVETAFNLLQALGLRKRGVEMISCPSCARQGFDVIKITKKIQERLVHIRKPVKVSLMGCVVNGPGEARTADVGFTGGQTYGTLHIRGEKPQKIHNKDIVQKMVEAVEAFETPKGVEPLSPKEAKSQALPKSLCS